MNWTQGDLQVEHLGAMWAINEEGLPGVGKVSPERLSLLLDYASHAFGLWLDDELLAFTLCLAPNSAYDSANYGWFNDRYTHFLYIDRVAVSAAWRSRGLGSALYQRVFDIAKQLNAPVAAEVNTRPPNPGSLRFHRRHRFAVVGEIVHRDYEVVTLMRPVDTPDDP